MERAKQKGRLGHWFFLCPRRHVLFGLALAVIGLFYLLRGNRGLMNALCGGFVHPYHRLMSAVTGFLPFSLMELIYTAIGVFAIWMIVRCGIRFGRRNERGKTLYLTVISLACVGLSFYAAYCLLWSTTYYADGFAEKSGIETAPVSSGELAAVTEYFIGLVNEYAPEMERDESGLFAEDRNELFAAAKTLYTKVETLFPQLSGPQVEPKRMYLYSELMSSMNFTGVFFPLTGEANLNIKSPAALLPATLAHELAHQRGVAAEDEANFVAILACLESGEPEFVYSAALLAYIHLGNALHSADYDAWAELYGSLCEEARADLNANNEYWARYKTKTAEVSEAVYTSFLVNNGQELGMKSYGACVDLLVSYYY